MPIDAPFPWFGGKRRVAAEVWARFGNVPNYVEPFFGSGAVLLNRPHPPKQESINDADGFVANFWRAVKHAPGDVACHADNPVNECDLHARHLWLVDHRQDLVARLMGDHNYYDAKIAGYWVWGISSWIGGDWCSGKGGPWVSEAGDDGVRVRVNRPGAYGGISCRRPTVNTKGAISLRNKGTLNKTMYALSARLRKTIVTCGDWSRVMGYSVTDYFGITGVFLDPPYAEDIRDKDCYATETHGVAKDVALWARENGHNPKLRIALCGYEGEHDMPDDWECFEWKATGGYGNKSENRGRSNAALERIWFSPHCLSLDDDLFNYKESNNES